MLLIAVEQAGAPAALSREAKRALFAAVAAGEASELCL